MGTWTQADVDTLKAAVAGGILEVRYDGPPMRLVRYQDLGQMRSLLAAMLADVARSSAGASSYAVAAMRKGL